MEVTINKFKILILVFLFLGIFQVNLFSLITNRVEGIVLDMETGDPLEGAIIQLYDIVLFDSSRLTEKISETYTNSKGKFKFELKRKGTYFVQCIKEGYISFLPEYYYGYLKPEFFNERVRTFELKEGQVKHLVIRIEKGGTLKGTFLKKDSSGISPVSTWVNLNRGKDSNEYFRDHFFIEITSYLIKDDGKFEINGLEPFSDYYMVLQPANGYPTTKIKNIDVKKNESKNLEITFDLSGQTGIQGNILINNEAPSSGWVTLRSNFLDNKGEYISCIYILEENDGTYYCKALAPGRYEMEVISYGENGTELKRKIDVDIESGVTKTQNFSN